MRVLQVHNYYRSDRPSGENQVVDRELALLRQSAIAVDTWYRHSDDLLRGGFLAKLLTAWRLGGNRQLVRSLREELAARPADLLHAHNVWPLFTLSLFEAAHELGLPTVLTFHNHRLIASNTHLLGQHGAQRPRDAAERLHLSRLMALHGTSTASWCYTRAVQRFWDRQIPQTCINAFICLTSFQRRLFEQAGLPSQKLVVKPNFLDHHGPIGTAPGEYVLFVGRLSAEKGVDILAKAWGETGLPLVIAGSGPLGAELRATGADVRGPQPTDEVLRLMAGARFLVMNSTCFEGFPLVLVEALASGTPCLVPALGGLPEIIVSGRLGLTFPPDNLPGLIAAARRLWEEAPAMRAACRTEYERFYTPARNLEMLTTIYANVLAGHPPDDGVSRIQKAVDTHA